MPILLPHSAAFSNLIAEMAQKNSVLFSACKKASLNVLKSSRLDLVLRDMNCATTACSAAPQLKQVYRPPAFYGSLAAARDVSCNWP
jgi:hypothetical protein